MRQKTLWITQTAALLALLIILQLATRSAGQLVTGSCVNAVLALAALICLFARKNLSPARRAAATAVAAAGKFALLYLLVVQLLCRVLTLNEKQIAAFSAMFSWPQLVTALIGTAVAMCVSPVIQKALGRE